MSASETTGSGLAGHLPLIGLPITVVSFIEDPLGSIVWLAIERLFWLVLVPFWWLVLFCAVVPSVLSLWFLMWLWSHRTIVSTVQKSVRRTS